MSYFKRRLAQAPRDAGFALDYVKAQPRRLSNGQRSAMR